MAFSKITHCHAISSHIRKPHQNSGHKHKYRKDSNNSHTLGKELLLVLSNFSLGFAIVLNFFDFFFPIWYTDDFIKLGLIYLNLFKPIIQTLILVYPTLFCLTDFHVLFLWTLWNFAIHHSSLWIIWDLSIFKCFGHFVWKESTIFPFTLSSHPTLSLPMCLRYIFEAQTYRE